MWADLTATVLERAAVTVVSESGTARLLDIANKRHDRVPLASRPLPLDGAWRPLRKIRVSPCGASILGTVDWAMGTHIWLVLDGLVPGWATTPVGIKVVAAIGRGEAPDVANGHPPERCHAAYCVLGVERSA